MCKMRGYLIVIFALLFLKYCICGDVVDLDGEIKDFVVGNGKLFVLTEHRLYQMRNDLSEEKWKSISNNTHPNKVNILVPFDDNGTLITCGTFDNGYCEVLDLNDITKSFYNEHGLPIGPRENEKSVAFIAARHSDSFLLVGKKEDYGDVQFSPKPILKLWNTLHSQFKGIFNDIDEGSSPCIQTTASDVEFVDGFQRVSKSELYVFLNARTDSESKAHVLWMDSSKTTKMKIFQSLQSAVIDCCKDKTRPVLVSSAVIPSENAVIWAGVFSAQDPQDPENTALALYDISRIQGKVKGFCAKGELTCDSSKRVSKLQPLSVVLKHSSMSSVAAMRNGPWIVLFMGTSDGQLIKLVLDDTFSPGYPTVLYESDNEQAVFPRMHFDPADFKHIYIALRNQLRRVSVVSCTKYSTLMDCRSALDPLCGWCLNILKCSTQDECSDSSWVSFPKNSLQMELLSFQMTKKSSSELTLHLALSLESTGNPAFSCVFNSGSVNLCAGSDLTAVFPKCSCRFSDQLLNTGNLKLNAIVTVEDQKIEKKLTLTNCSSITDNSPNVSSIQCVQCISSGCGWISSSQRCDWTNGSGPQLHIQDACKGLHYKYKEPEIFSLEPHKVSFHGRNNVLLRGRNLESVTKIRIQGDLDRENPKESPVFDRSSDSLRFHIPPSETKGTVKMCVVTPDNLCHSKSIITYSSQPRCTGLQPRNTWSRGGRKINIQGTSMEFVESVVVHPSNNVLKTHYNTSSGGIWFYSPRYDGTGQFSLYLNVGNSTVDCVTDFSYKPNPEFTGFTISQVAHDLEVNIQKKADVLNLSMSEVNIMGDQLYQCVVERTESNAIICVIRGQSRVDSITITIGNYDVMMGNSIFCLSSHNAFG